MEIKGEILDIIYKNEINSYTIAEFETDDELTTVVGYLPFVNSGETLKLIPYLFEINLNSDKSGKVLFEKISQILDFDLPISVRKIFG